VISTFEAAVLVQTDSVGIWLLGDYRRILHANAATKKDGVSYSLHIVVSLWWISLPITDDRSECTSVDGASQRSSLTALCGRAHCTVLFNFHSPVVTSNYI
jgi:hypothetical protein